MSTHRDPDDSLDQERSSPRRATGKTSSGGDPASRFREQAAARQGDHPGDDAEEDLWQGGYSAKAMVGAWIVLALLSIALLVVPFVMPDLITIPIALGVILVLWVIGGLQYAYRRLGYHYRLTTQRFIHQTGILKRQTDRIEVIDIDDVSFTQGPVQRMFGIGTIELTSSDRSHPKLSMIGIADVQQVAGLIDDVRRKERRRRSLHIESI